MISNNIKESNRAISIKKEKKTKSLIELIEIIEQIKKQQNKNDVKIINKKRLIEEKKDLEEVSEVNNKKTFRKLEKNYISLVQNIIYEKLFYNLTGGFNYDNYKINTTQKDQVLFTQSNGTNTTSKETKNYDSPIMDNQKVDDILKEVKINQFLGKTAGDYIKPEGISPDDFEKFYYFKKINPLWISMKYELSS
jgi:hypothetical protein